MKVEQNTRLHLAPYHLIGKPNNSFHVTVHTGPNIIPEWNCRRMRNLPMAASAILDLLAEFAIEPHKWGRYHGDGQPLANLQAHEPWRTEQPVGLAKTAIVKLPESDYREMLVDLADYVVARVV